MCSLPTCVISPFLFLIKEHKRILELWKSWHGLLWSLWTSRSCEQCFLCAHSHAKYVSPTSHLPHIFLYFPADFKTQNVRHILRKANYTLCADILNTCKVHIANANTFKATLFQIMGCKQCHYLCSFRGRVASDLLATMEALFPACHSPTPFMWRWSLIN